MKMNKTENENPKITDTAEAWNETKYRDTPQYINAFKFELFIFQNRFEWKYTWEYIYFTVLCKHACIKWAINANKSKWERKSNTK